MTSSQGTLIQRWNKSCTVFVTVVVTLLHLTAFAVAAYLCPELFTARSYEGAHCQPGHRADTFEVAAADCGAEYAAAAGACLPRVGGDVVRLADLRMSFKLPAADPGDSLSVWNWRLVASLAVSLQLLEPVTAGNSSQLEEVEQLELPVLLSASIDYAPAQYLATAAARPSSGDCIPASPWHSKAILLHVNRSLHCGLVRRVSSRGSRADTAEVHCSLHPLFELLVLSNSSYIVQVRLQQQEGGQGAELLATNATVSSHLTVARETAAYHRACFYLKCLFTPLVVMALVWFMVRLCLNDLYVTIHDRLLMTAGLAQVLANVPAEVLVANYPLPQLTLLGPVTHLVLLTALALFWTVFSLDKLADNEPWERTTRYYARPLCAVLATALAALAGLLFLRLPPLGNPFTSHWQAGAGAGAAIYIALGFTFSLAVTIATFHTYLSILVFRVVCDISVRYISLFVITMTPPNHTAVCRYPGQGRGAWRLKVVLLYCLLVSGLACLGCVLRLAVTLCLHWNTDTVHTQPLPFSVASAGIFYLGELAATNLHVIALLVALSRVSRGHVPGDTWYTPVSPVMYSPAPREEQLHLWDLAATQPSPMHK